MDDDDVSPEASGGENLPPTGEGPSGDGSGPDPSADSDGAPDESDAPRHDQTSEEDEDELVGRLRAAGAGADEIAAAVAAYRRRLIETHLSAFLQSGGRLTPAQRDRLAELGFDVSAQRALNADGQPGEPVPAGLRVNPEYEAWLARAQAPRYLNADGTPFDIDSIGLGGWYPGKESFESFAARQGVNVVPNPDYVAPGERPNQYLDGSGQPVPETWEQAVAAYQQDGETLGQDVARYETEAAAYRTDFDAYEAAVNAWNENPGSAEELKALQDRRERLATEQARLSASAAAINARAQARQADAQNLNHLAQLEPSERDRVIRATAGPPEAREARYQEALEQYQARRAAPRPALEDSNQEHIEGSFSRYYAWRAAINQAAIDLALTAVASGRPVPDGLGVRGTYVSASLSDAATPVEVVQIASKWRAERKGCGKSR